MTIYYDDLVLAGTAYAPESFGQNTGGYADDLVFVASNSLGGDIQVGCGVGLLAMVGLAASVTLGGSPTVVDCTVGEVTMVGVTLIVITPTVVESTVGRLLLRGLRIEGAGGGLSGGSGTSPEPDISIIEGLSPQQGISG